MHVHSNDFKWISNIIWPIHYTVVSNAELKVPNHLLRISSGDLLALNCLNTLPETNTRNWWLNSYFPFVDALFPSASLVSGSANKYTITLLDDIIATIPKYLLPISCWLESVVWSPTAFPGNQPVGQAEWDTWFLDPLGCVATPNVQPLYMCKNRSKLFHFIWAQTGAVVHACVTNMVSFQFLLHILNLDITKRWILRLVGPKLPRKLPSQRTCDLYGTQHFEVQQWYEPWEAHAKFQNKSYSTQTASKNHGHHHTLRTDSYSQYSNVFHTFGCNQSQPIASKSLKSTLSLHLGKRYTSIFPFPTKLILPQSGCSKTWYDHAICFRTSLLEPLGICWCCLSKYVYANLGVYLFAQPLLTQLLQIKEGFIGLTNSPAHPRPTVELLRVWKTDTVDLSQFLSSDKIGSCLIYHVSKGALILSMVYDYAKLWYVTAISIVYIKPNVHVLCRCNTHFTQACNDVCDIYVYIQHTVLCIQSWKTWCSSYYKL